MKKSALYVTLHMMARDLVDIVHLSVMTLPFDPWIVKHVREAQELCPDLFEDKDKSGPPRGGNAEGRHLALVIPLKRPKGRTNRHGRPGSARR